MLLRELKLTAWCQINTFDQPFNDFLLLYLPHARMVSFFSLTHF